MWEARHRIPVLLADESPVAQFVLAGLRGKPIEFVYWGGSEPGRVRKIRITDIFRLDESGPVYVEGFCFMRQATRVFRLDRVSLDTDGLILEDASD